MSLFVSTFLGLFSILYFLKKKSPIFFIIFSSFFCIYQLNDILFFLDISRNTIYLKDLSNVDFDKIRTTYTYFLILLFLVCYGFNKKIKIIKDNIHIHKKPLPAKIYLKSFLCLIIGLFFSVYLHDAIYLKKLSNLELNSLIIIPLYASFLYFPITLNHRTLIYLSIITFLLGQEIILIIVFSCIVLNYLFEKSHKYSRKKFFIFIILNFLILLFLSYFSSNIFIYNFFEFIYISLFHHYESIVQLAFFLANGKVEGAPLIFESFLDLVLFNKFLDYNFINFFNSSYNPLGTILAPTALIFFIYHFGIFGYFVSIIYILAILIFISLISERVLGKNAFKLVFLCAFFVLESSPEGLGLIVRLIFFCILFNFAYKNFIKLKNFLIQKIF